MILLVGAALAAAPVRWVEGLAHDEVLVRAAFRPEDAEPLFPGWGGRLGEWWRVRDPDAVAIGNALLARGAERAYLPSLPAPPPVDLEPTTPDFREDQEWLDDLGAPEATRWTLGAGVTVADVEYAWQEDHEDLESTVGALAWGEWLGVYAFHGTSVLGQLVGGDNGYGVVGVAPDATPRVVVPFLEDGSYAPAPAILAAGALLGPGDVLLIELQAYCPDGVGYCPVEVEDAVFDAIAAVVDMGVVVVEPAANGARDLDDEVFEGRFDREQRDSGAILVGGGASPLSGAQPGTWYPYGSNYGRRVDVQGWYDSIVTTTNGDEDGWYADLFFPGGDGRQGYTSRFGGTSGASPMVAGAAIVAQAAAWEAWGEPWSPEALRAAMVATGRPQPAGDPYLIGPRVDLRALLRYGVR